MIRRVTIIGMGLMGGSLGLALRRKGWRVVGVGRNPTRLLRARALGAAHEVTTDISKGVREADVVVLAVPVNNVVMYGRKVRPFLKSGAFVTDVGSVKGTIARTFKDWPVFVGAHPMCGSEKTGVTHARPDLYRGATCVLTPLRETSRSALSAAQRFWKTLGARVLVLSPEEHDRCVALVSHLPHLVAEALVMTLPLKTAWVSRVAAGSFRDATRVAAADPSLWSQIFAMNQPALRRAAADFHRSFAALLKDGPREKRLREVGTRHTRFLREAP